MSDTRKHKNAEDLIRSHVFQNQDALVRVLLSLEYYTTSKFKENFDFPRELDDVINYSPRRDIDDLIRDNPQEYEEFILDNNDLLIETYSDEYDEWRKRHPDFEEDNSSEFLDWLEEHAPFGDEEGEIRMTRQELLANIDIDEDDIETLYDYLERNDVEIQDESHQVFSWYLVSDWLADRLETKGETILRFYNQEWWGRSTYGQQICADGVIQEIAWELWGDVTEGEDDNELHPE